MTTGGAIDGKDDGDHTDDEAPNGAPKPDIRELKRAEAMTKMKTKKTTSKAHWVGCWRNSGNLH